MAATRVSLLIHPAGVYADDRTSGPAKAVVQTSTASNVRSWVYWPLVRCWTDPDRVPKRGRGRQRDAGDPAAKSALTGAIGATNG